MTPTDNSGPVDNALPGAVAAEEIEQVGDGTSVDVPPKPKTPIHDTAKHAFLVGAGILLSRIVGLIRQRVFAHYFGRSAAGDAFAAAFRIPNFLQNVFGEGALSASFIPIYSKLLATDDEEEASHVAGAIFGILGLVTATIVLIGVIFTPYFVSVIAWGFEGETRNLTIRLTRILFPGTGLLVMSAWCLGILNSHRRFFLSYTAPVAWNIAIISALLFFGGRVNDFALAEATAWGSVVGSFLQFAIQLPTVFSVGRRLRPVIDLASPNVRLILHNFVPVFVSRGVVQISAFVDAALASLLPEGAVVSLTYAQSLYTLPVSLFGMSISAAELPTMSRAVGNADEIAVVLRQRLEDALHRMAFFIVPSSVAFLALGDVIVAALYQSGKFQYDDTIYIWAILAGSTVGLLASTLGRLYSSTYYALHDTRTPLRFAIVRVTLTTILGYLFAIPLPPLIGLNPKWGVVGLTVSAGIAGWVEFFFLRRKLDQRIGEAHLSLWFLVKLWSAAIIAAAIAFAFKLLMPAVHPIIVAIVVLGAYGIIYFAMTFLFKIPQGDAIRARVFGMLKRRF